MGQPTPPEPAGTDSAAVAGGCDELLLAVCKVFLLDTRHLDGLLRAGSFLGLGLTLMVLGYVYQRFVIKPGTGPAHPVLKD